MTHNSLHLSMDRETVRSVTKLLFVAAWVVVMLYLLTWLPGLDGLVPRTPVTFAALVGAIATAVVVALLFALAPKLAVLARASLDGPKRVVEHLASVVYWFVALAAVLLAHRGFADAVTPLLGGLEWVYDVAFLLVALPLIAVIGARLYASLEPGSELLADRVTSENGE
jgi:hypothetical protein